jgi:hypothetical protein
MTSKTETKKRKLMKTSTKVRAGKFWHPTDFWEAIVKLKTTENSESTSPVAPPPKPRRFGFGALQSIAGVATQTGLVAGKITLSEEYSHDFRRWKSSP